MRGKFQFVACATLGSLLAASVSASEIEWIPTLKQAKQVAASEGKLIVVDISAAWCPPCQRMARDVYPDPKFIEFSKTQVFMLLDVDQDAEGERIARQYEVRVYPTILVLDREGKEIDRLTGGRSTEGLIEDLQRVFDSPVPAQQLNQQAERQPDNFELQRQAGLRAHDRDDFKKARIYLNRALELADGGQPEVRTELLAALAQAAFETGKYEDVLHAVDQLERANEGFRRLHSLQMLKARSLLALKRHEEGLVMINAMLKSASTRGDGRRLMDQLPGKYRTNDKVFQKHFKQANKLADKGQFTEALQAVEQALEASPDSAQAFNLLAQIHRALASRLQGEASHRHLALAVDAILICRRLEPGDVLHHASAKRMLASHHIRSVPSDEKLQKKFEKAETLFLMGQFRNAAELYIDIIEREPDFAAAYRHLGDCFFHNNQFEKALQLYLEAGQLSPADARSFRFAADALVKMERFEEARSMLMTTLLADPSYPLAWANLRDTAPSDKGFERHFELVPIRMILAAPDQYEELLQQRPAATRPAWRAYLDTKLLWRNRRFAAKHGADKPYLHTATEEIESLTRLAEQWAMDRLADPALSDPDMDFLRQLHLDGALAAFVYLELFNEIYRIEFDAWKATHADSVKGYLDKYVYNQAHRALVAGYNNSALAAYNHGVSLHESNTEEAIGAYRLALEYEPYMQSALINLSMLLSQSDRMSELTSVLHRWIEGYPDHARPYEQLATVAFKQEKYSEAIKWAEQALALSQDGEEKRRIEYNLNVYRQYQ